MVQIIDQQFRESAEENLVFVLDCHSNAIPCTLCIVTGVSG